MIHRFFAVNVFYILFDNVDLGRVRRGFHVCGFVLRLHFRSRPDLTIRNVVRLFEGLDYRFHLRLLAANGYNVS